MLRFILTFTTIFLFVSCHDLDDHLLKTDDELSTEPGIAEITVDASYNIEIHLARDYTDECAVYIERKIGSGAFAPIAWVKKNDMVYLDTTIDKESDKFYTYRYYISKKGCKTNLSPVDTFSYISRTLNQPTNVLLITVENQGVDISWKDNSRFEVGYIIERNDGTGFTEIANLSADYQYYADRGIPAQPATPLNLTYRVKAYQGTKYSIAVTCSTTYSGIGSPTNLRVVNSSSSNCVIKWTDNSQIEDGFIIERKKDAGNFITVAIKNANDTTHTDTISSLGDYTYRVRARSGSNYSGYSNEVKNNVISSNSFIDPRNGKVYKTVTIGTQVWMAENLNFDTLNGTGSWYYNNNSGNDTLGRLYNWETAKKVSPPGWHLPSKTEFETLLNYLGGSGSTSYYKLIVGGVSGFNAKFGGYRDRYSNFGGKDYTGNFWSTELFKCNVNSTSSPPEAVINYDVAEVAFSVRCIKN